METCKVENIEKNKISIIKCYLRLYPYWKNNYTSNKNNEDKENALLNMMFVDQVLLKKISEREKEVLLYGIIHKDVVKDAKSSLFYSESGLRNQVNIICKKLAERIEEDEIKFL